ncbi:MAG TPA: hypothetical protein VGL76_07565 [Gaiellaceae bacterium]
MVPTGGIGQRYATQVGALWVGLARTLSELEQYAADPLDIEEADADVLRKLQYRLHCASEDVFALAPPAGVERLHIELGEALTAARDSTADVVEALDEDGADAALPCIYEWRGALFGVRLARLHFAAPPEPVDEPQRSRRDLGAPLKALVLVLAGAGAFTGGAVVGFWPLWAAGMLAVCGSFLVYKP